MKLMPENPRLKSLLIVAAIAILVVASALYAYKVLINNGDTLAPDAGTVPTMPKSTEVPKLTTQVVVSGQSNVWDVGFLPDKTMIFTERDGAVRAFVNGQTRTLATIADVYSRGEGGLMGMVVDVEFSENRYIYTCFNSTKAGLDVRLVRWKVNADTTALTDRTDIITGMPSNTSGRHSGCRPRMAHTEHLWVGTGDIAVGTNAQDPKSLGGKILRVDRGGKGVDGNLGEPFDLRIYSYGHRNTQGIALFNKPKNGSFGYSLEHGSHQDDEVNELRQGNFGWDPVPGYNESVPMTDKNKFPNAIDAVWRSGSPTIAISGGTLLNGPRWKAWDGALAMGVLKDKHVRILRFQDDGKLKDSANILTEFGRIRSVVQGPDDLLYVTTDNGDGKDSIILVTPS